MDSKAESQVALFIDYENIDISSRKKLGNDNLIDCQSILDSAAEFGRVAIRKAYADWIGNESSQHEILRLGIQPINLPTKKRGKNIADIRIVIDALETIDEKNSNISHIMLVSGDGDLTDLVHHLRARGKIVVGMGITGCTAEYLIKACDKFIFYDSIHTTYNKRQEEETSGTKVKTAIYDVSEARQLLRTVLNMHNGDWVNGSKIKDTMQRLNPTFDHRNYKFDRFKDFLEAQNDIAILRSHPDGGHLEVQSKAEKDLQSAVDDTETLLDRYLKLIAGFLIRMTPTEHRPTIIRKFYEIHTNDPGKSLNELKEELHTYVDEYATDIKHRYVTETIHQLYRSNCLKIDSSDSRYPLNTSFWNRKFSFKSDINGAEELIEKCDRYLLHIISEGIGSMDDINVEVAARLLYGSTKIQKRLGYVSQLIKTQFE